MNFGLIVEGLTDRNAYPHIIRNIRDDANLVHPPIPCDSVQRLRGKFVGFLKYFDSKRDLQLEKVFVVRDSDCRDPIPLEEELSQILQRQPFRPYFTVQFHATKCTLETLLLADINAINQAAMQRGQPGNVAPLGLRLEEVVDVKPLFRKTLSQAQLQVTPPVYGEIASHINIEALSRNCPDFRRFIAKIRDC